MGWGIGFVIGAWATLLTTPNPTLVSLSSRWFYYSMGFKIIHQID